MKFLEPPVLIIVLAIALIIFGPKRLPELGKTLGKTIRSVREGLDGAPAEPAVSAAVAVTATPAQAAAREDKPVGESSRGHSCPVGESEAGRSA